MIGRHAALGEKADAARADIGARRVEQRAVIGERDVIEIEMHVVGVERAPPAVAALHAEDPFLGAVDRLAVAGPVEAVERQGNRGGVVEIGVMRVGVLERPAARPQPGTGRGPVADRVEHLLVGEPVDRAADRRRKPRVADLHQRVAGERAVPHRREAGLAVAVLAVEDEQLADRSGGGGAIGMIRRISQAIEHHQRVRHRREDAAEPVLAVEPLGDEGDRLVRWRAAAGPPGTSARPAAAAGRAGQRRDRPARRSAARSSCAPSPAARQTAPRWSPRAGCAPSAAAPSAPGAAPAPCATSTRSCRCETETSWAAA